MLLQSHAGAIEFLPALPKSWTTGSVRGLCVRGGFEVDIAWTGGKLVGAVVRAKHGGIFQIRYGDKIGQAAAKPGEALRFNGSLVMNKVNP
jgi:alpha-L-fucosidase 2